MVLSLVAPVEHNPAEQGTKEAMQHKRHTNEFGSRFATADFQLHVI